MSTYTNLLKQRFTESGTLYGLWLSLGSGLKSWRIPVATGCVSTWSIHRTTAMTLSRNFVQLPPRTCCRPSRSSARRRMKAGWSSACSTRARTLMFLNVETAEEAAHVVRLTQYPNADARDGLRGAAGAVRAAALG